MLVWKIKVVGVVWVGAISHLWKLELPETLFWWNFRLFCLTQSTIHRIHKHVSFLSVVRETADLEKTNLLLSVIIVSRAILHKGAFILVIFDFKAPLLTLIISFSWICYSLSDYWQISPSRCSANYRIPCLSRDWRVQ